MIYMMSMTSDLKRGEVSCFIGLGGTQHEAQLARAHAELCWRAGDAVAWLHMTVSPRPYVACTEVLHSPCPACRCGLQWPTMSA